MITYNFKAYGLDIHRLGPIIVLNDAAQQKTFIVGHITGNLHTVLSNKERRNVESALQADRRFTLPRGQDHLIRQGLFPITGFDPNHFGAKELEIQATDSFFQAISKNVAGNLKCNVNYVTHEAPIEESDEDTIYHSDVNLEHLDKYDEVQDVSATSTMTMPRLNSSQLSSYHKMAETLGKPGTSETMSSDDDVTKDKDLSVTQTDSDDTHSSSVSSGFVPLGGSGNDPYTGKEIDLSSSTTGDIVFEQSNSPEDNDWHMIPHDSEEKESGSDATPPASPRK